MTNTVSLSFIITIHDLYEVLFLESPNTLFQLTHFVFFIIQLTVKSPLVGGITSSSMGGVSSIVFTITVGKEAIVIIFVIVNFQTSVSSVATFKL